MYSARCHSDAQKCSVHSLLLLFHSSPVFDSETVIQLNDFPMLQRPDCVQFVDPGLQFRMLCIKFLSRLSTTTKSFATLTIVKIYDLLFIFLYLYILES